MKLDTWQEKVLATEGNVCLRSGRQVGKSTVISVKAGGYAVKNPNKIILVVSAVERQAYLLFEKILDYLYKNYKTYVKKGKDRPTKSKIKLNNGSTILCLPTGLSGVGIRGYTVDLLIADEAAFIPEEVWTAVTPMLAVSKGKIILLSTPHGRGGYYYSCFEDENFTPFHISSEECPRVDPKFLERERARMTKVQYAQEYLGEFVDELRQFFPTDLIKECMTLGCVPTRNKYTKNFLGVDVARLGEDQTVLVSMERLKSRLKQIDMEITTKTMLTDTVDLIKKSDSVYKYARIYIDEGGMGYGVLDPLLKDSQTRRKVVGINNAKKNIDSEGSQKNIMKVDLYANLLRLMEQRKVDLFNDPEILLSLKSIQYDYTDEKKIKIFGNYSHIAEALIRAAWCMKDKALNIWIY